MEGFLIIILILFGGWIFRAIVAGGKSLATGDSFEESMQGFPNWQIRVIKNNEENLNSLDIYDIEIKGLIPINSTMNLAVVSSILDVTDQEKPKPIISFVDITQEQKTSAFQSLAPLGNVQPNVGYKSWVNVGRVSMKMIQPPVSGNRSLEISVSLINVNNPPSIILGFYRDQEGIIASKVFPIDYNFKDKGYEETAKERDQANGLVVKLGVAVAMSDGSLDDSEGNSIKKWIKKTISPFSEERQNTLKKLYNEAFKTSYQEAKEGNLVLSKITNSLKKISDKKIKYDAVELCHEVMAADGKLEDEEIKIVRKIGKSLGIDQKEMEAIRDRKLIDLSGELESDTSIEEMLGIQKNWSKIKVKEHLRKEFQKWNNRLSSIDKESEKANAQRMLDLISKARTKYD